MSGNLDKTRRLVGLAIFTALVVVLQIIATFVKIGTFPLNLTLIPIVVGAAIYGIRAGAFLGAVFGGVVLIATVSGADAFAYLMWAAQPALTLVLIMVKGTAAGLCAGLAYKMASKRNIYFGVFFAAVISPLVNTGIFCLAMALFYQELLSGFAGGTNLLYFAFFGLTGINFLIEFAINVVLGPTVARLIRIGKKEKII